MNKVIVLGVGVLTAGAVAGAIVGGKTAYAKYNRVQKTVDLWKNRFYGKITQDDVAWG
jgi:hypothetical protein|tara:strand:- start:556 stop:729 length:174 start_codon:yes stop_codon:yes gene_type:complete